MKFGFSLIIIYLLCVSSAFATPSITSATGTLTSGSSVVISGSGFGSKSTAAPLSWDNFEAQTVGNTVHNTSPVTGPNWTLMLGSPATDPLIFDSTRAISGTKSVKVHWEAESINAFGWTGQGPLTSLYITYWRYQTGTYTQGVNNHKQFYVYGTQSGMPQVLQMIPAYSRQWALWNNGACEPKRATYTPAVTYDQTKDTWQRWEMYVVLNTDGVANGISQAWMNGTQYVNLSNYKWRCDGTTGTWTDFRLGHMFQGAGSGPPDAVKEVWFDDVYIDVTPARVEVCAGSTWGARGVCHIQPASAWANGEITITYNSGNMPAEAQKYLYVVDSAGSANANGFVLNRSNYR